MNSIFRKIAFRFSLLFLIVIVAAGLFSILSLDSTYRDGVQQELMGEAHEIAHLMRTGADPNDFAEVVDDISDIRITLIDLGGTVTLDTRADVAALDNHITRPEVAQAIREGEGANVRHSDTLGTDLMYTALYSQPLSLVIRTSRPLSGIASLSAAVWTPLVVALAAAFVLCFLFALLISRSITKPIIQIKNDTVRISNGQYDYTQRVKTGDELEQLSDALGDMVVSLKSNIDDVSEKNSRLEAVFKAIPGGIIAVDKEERVIMANPAAKEIFSILGPPEGKHFMEVARHVMMEEIVREAMHSKKVLQHEVSILRGMHEMVLQVFAVSVEHDYGVILLAQDITHVRKLENMRSDFAANVSHELKTPLTVISGFIDTLKDEAISKEDNERFLDIISLESERLTRLIDDVLALSEIENTAALPETVADVRSGVQAAVRLLESKAKEKGIALDVSLPKESVPVAAEMGRIKQMAINLLDNAIKYTPNGGSVTVSLEKEEPRAVLTVADTGIGIPEENLPRLFERFYRVDKSRSRALGGTGLGLAIVKHIVSLIGGHITVESEVDSGTAFHVYLPLVPEDDGNE